MTSLSSVVLATDAPSNSEPESLDSLDFDDWEGQFEFVGNNNNHNGQQQTKHSATSTTTTTTTATRIANDLEDLNLTVPQYNETITNRPILIDEETFLSLQLTDIDSNLKYDPANDDDDVDDEDLDDQPPSLLIKNALNHINFDHSVPSNFNDKQYSTDDIIQTRNRLNQQQNIKNSSTHRSDKNNNHQYNDKMNKNQFANELCDSLLKEQVSSYPNFSFEHIKRLSEELILLCELHLNTYVKGKCASISFPFDIHISNGTDRIRTKRNETKRNSTLCCMR